ncbi:hypothetical protein [Candidatus Tisiphia endosymbiont of Beris chalybata]|uniref:hypothetical protein n=1 Tax=Candidatus Tisiphia endosymbiont of Beris chalybata TaxID=3066262 RepID=UPI00312C8024
MSTQPSIKDKIDILKESLIAQSEESDTISSQLDLSKVSLPKENTKKVEQITEDKKITPELTPSITLLVEEEMATTSKRPLELSNDTGKIKIKKLKLDETSTTLFDEILYTVNDAEDISMEASEVAGANSNLDSLDSYE